MEPNARAHAVADNGIAAGVLLASGRYNVGDLDFTEMEGSVSVNSAETNTGKKTSIMASDIPATPGSLRAPVKQT